MQGIFVQQCSSGVAAANQLRLRLGPVSRNIHSLTTPHAKYGGRCSWGWVGICVKLYPRVLYSFFLSLVPLTRPQLTLSSVYFRSMHPKMCFGSGCVPLGSVCPGAQIFTNFTAKKTFPIVRMRLFFSMGVNRKCPLWLMIAP